MAHIETVIVNGVPTEVQKLDSSAQQVDDAVSRALPGGAIDVAVDQNVGPYTAAKVYASRDACIHKGNLWVNTSGSNVSGVEPGTDYSKWNVTYSNPNFLDNWDFRNPVNQRGQTSYTNQGYTIDRWYMDLAQGGATLSVEDGYIRLAQTASGNDGVQSIHQPIEAPWRFSSKTITISVKYRSPGHVSQFLLTVNNALLMESYTVLPASDTWNIVTKTITLPVIAKTNGQLSFWIYADQSKTLGYTDYESVKIEPGSVSTLANDPPADFGAEKAKCQRYYWKRHYVQYETVGLGFVGAEWTMFSIGVGQEMRSNTPTVKLTGTLSTVGAQPAVPISGFASTAMSGCTVHAGASVTAATQGTCYAFFADPSGGDIEFLEDL